MSSAREQFSGAKTSETTSPVPDLDAPPPPSTADRRPRMRAFLGIFGPGLVTGVADDDPSGVATYSQAGAAAGSACSEQHR